MPEKEYQARPYSLYERLILAGVQAERELCAKIAESVQAVESDPHWDAAKTEIAEAIRAHRISLELPE